MEEDVPFVLADTVQRVPFILELVVVPHDRGGQHEREDHLVLGEQAVGDDLVAAVACVRARF